MTGPLDSTCLEEGSKPFSREWVFDLSLDKVVEGKEIIARAISEGVCRRIRTVIMTDASGQYFIAGELGEKIVGYYNDGQRFADSVLAVGEQRKISAEIQKGREGNYEVRVLNEDRMGFRLTA